MSKYKINKNKTNKLTNMEENNIEAIYGKGFLDKFRGGNTDNNNNNNNNNNNTSSNEYQVDANDLYGDLDVSAESQQLRKAEAKCVSLERKCQALNFENQRLSDLLDRTNDDKATLERNISILYKTAKENIERLKKQNGELQKQIEQQYQQQRGGSSRP